MLLRPRKGDSRLETPRLKSMPDPIEANSPAIDKSTEGGRLLRFVRIIAVPVLITLYAGCVPLLLVRNLAHLLTRKMDNAFDAVCRQCSWDNSFWPFPRASEEPLPGDPNA